MRVSYEPNDALECDGGKKSRNVLSWLDEVIRKGNV